MPNIQSDDSNRLFNLYQPTRDDIVSGLGRRWFASLRDQPLTYQEMQLTERELDLCKEAVAQSVIDTLKAVYREFFAQAPTASKLCSSYGPFAEDPLCIRIAGHSDLHVNSSGQAWELVRVEVETEGQELCLSSSCVRPIRHNGRHIDEHGVIWE